LQKRVYGGVFVLNTNPEQTRQLFDERIHALAQAHDLLLQANWGGATLEINSSCGTDLHKGFGQRLVQLDLEANQKACFDFDFPRQG